MESKLSSIGVHGKEQLPFIRDILGGQVGETFHRGIVHSEDNKEFYAKLCSLESVWNEHETAVAGNDPVFYAGLCAIMLTSRISYASASSC